MQDLILNDMLIHSGSIEEISDKFKENHRLVVNLLLSALSEVHSNCLMFGGVDSTSFKIKLKKVDQRCKLVTRLMAQP